MTRAVARAVSRVRAVAKVGWGARAGRLFLLGLPPRLPEQGAQRGGPRPSDPVARIQEPGTGPPWGPSCSTRSGFPPAACS